MEMDKWVNNLLGGRFFVYYCGKEVARDFIIKQIDAPQAVPPYHHLVYPFEAVCPSGNFECFDISNYMSEKAISSGFKHIMLAGIYEVPFHIDSYNREMIPFHMDLDGNWGGERTTGAVVINGHFDSHDFQDFKEEIIKNDVIKSRFEILDL